VTLPLLACLLVLVALGLIERLERDRSWRAVPVRVHVNGSRGKSTVTRLIWSALVEAGVPAVAKTTGTAARLLLPDRTEQPIERRAPASIREQLVLLRRARRLGARAAVVECMALDPELQWVAEQCMVGATIGVVTNVRRDHTEIMGSRLEAIAASLANSIPRRGVLVTGERRFLQLFEQRAAGLGTRVVCAAPSDAAIGKSVPDWLREDMQIALAVTRELGIDDATALRGFAVAPPDPGAVREGVLTTGGRSLRWLDATAANDPDSLRMLVDASAAKPGDLVIYNNRADRSPRLACFAAASPTLGRAPRLVVTGARPPLTVWRRLRRARGERGREGPLDFVPRRRLAGLLSTAPRDAGVIFCGNTRGLDLTRLLDEVASRG
jgi:poly-gamma-glutamate synthase PgsB/CapB